LSLWFFLCLDIIDALLSEIVFSLCNSKWLVFCYCYIFYGRKIAWNFCIRWIFTIHTFFLHHFGSLTVWRIQSIRQYPAYYAYSKEKKKIDFCFRWHQILKWVVGWNLFTYLFNFFLFSIHIFSILNMRLEYTTLKDKVAIQCVLWGKKTKGYNQRHL
jgi:hypothetical protein